MAIDHQDAVGDQTSTTGTGSFVIDGVALTGCVSFATGLTDGATYNYRAQDAANGEWEVGQGVWTAGTSTLTRATIFRSSNGGSKTVFSAGAKSVGIVAVATDFTADVASATHAAAGKTTPVDADELPLVDSAASNVLKKLTWANLKATLNSVYQAALVSGTNIKTVGGVSLLGSGDVTVSATPGGSDTQLQYNNSSAFGGAAGWTTDGNVLTNTQAIAATSTDGVVLKTSTAATVGAQKYSPRVRWLGKGWKTTATAASQDVEFIAEVQPVQGSANPSANLVFSYQVNGGGYAATGTLSSAGVFTAKDGGGYTFSDTTTGFYFNSGSDGGGVLYRIGGNVGMRLGIQGKLSVRSDGLFGISPSIPVDQTVDIAWMRNAAGVWEATSGAANTYRDVKLRNLIAGGGNGSYIGTPSMTVANLAAAATAGAGARAFVTDATATTFLSTVAGGGANKVPVVSDGTNWLIG